MASRDFRTILDKLREQNWDVTRTSNGHYRAAPPNGQGRIIHFSKSGDPCAFHNALRDLRKQGFVWEDEPRVGGRGAAGELSDRSDNSTMRAGAAGGDDDGRVARAASE